MRLKIQSEATTDSEVRGNNYKQKEGIFVKNGRCAIYRAERKKGRTYQDIANEYGVSRQMVYQACSPFETLRFRIIKPEDCVYVNIRNWLNSHRISRAKLLAMLGLEPMAETKYRIKVVLRGESEPKKSLIDKLMILTGLSYEKLFERDVEVQSDDR